MPYRLCVWLVCALTLCTHAILLLLVVCYTAGGAFTVVGEQEMTLQVQPGSPSFALLLVRCL
jgi:hypothetical protein